MKPKLDANFDLRLVSLLDQACAPAKAGDCSPWASEQMPSVIVAERFMPTQ